MDERRRRLERAGGDDVEACARLLLERVRAGELPRERLELAARLDDPAAAAAVGGAIDGAFPRPCTSTALTTWLRELDASGQEACVRAALAATRVALRKDDVPAARRLMTLAESQLDHLGVADYASGPIERLRGELRAAAGADRGGARGAAISLAWAATWRRASDDSPRRRELRRLLDAETHPLLRTLRQREWDRPGYVLGNLAAAAAASAIQVAGSRPVVRAIYEELLAWALA